MILELLVIAAGIFLVNVLDSTRLFDIAGVRPDFTILLVIFFSLKKGQLSGLWIGFFGGLLADVSFGAEEIGGKVYDKIGIHSLSYSLVGYFLGKFGRNYYSENYISISTYAFLFTVIIKGFSYILFSIFFYKDQNYSVLATSIYNTAIAPLSFFIFSWVYKLEGIEGNRYE